MGQGNLPLACEIVANAAHRGLNLSDYPTGIAYSKAIRGNRFGHNAASADRGVFANGDAGANDRAAAKPDIIADGNGRRHFYPRPTYLQIGGMVSGVNLDIGSNQHIVSDRYPIAVEDGAIEIDIEIFACPNMTTIVAMEGRVDFKIGAKIAKQQSDHFLTLP